MDRLEVPSAELRMLSGKWHSQTAQLRVTPPPKSGLSCQPSAAAVNGGHAAVELAAAGLIDRMTDVATRVAAADAGYSAREAISAEAFSTVGSRGANR